MNWCVLIENNGKLCTYNIFNNHYFREGVQKLFTIPELTYDEMSGELDALARWQFWARTEYEIVVYGWPTASYEKGHKIDVFYQLELNWERFVDYVYSEYCFGSEERE